MNNDITLRRSKFLLSVISGVGLMAGVAIAQQVCPTLPTMVFPAAPGVMSLKGAPIPMPKQLDTVIKDRQAAIALGKAFYWDKQAGSDGQACASCHFHAGADNRTKNQLSPPQRAVPSDTEFHRTRTGDGGPNYQLLAGDFPFHVLSNPLDRNSQVLFHSNDIVSSQGAFGGGFLQFLHKGRESCSLDNESIFKVNGKLTRKVPPRNAPTTYNAIFQFRSFWDGRANNHFNGVNPFGRRDPNARILVRQPDGSVMPEILDLENAALASQAVGPLLNTTEVSCSKRTFELVARKLFSEIPRPLHFQKVEQDDSVLGPYAPLNGNGLRQGITYPMLIEAAFHDKYWLAPGYVSPDGYTLMEENFSMFWGLAIMMYESTLVSDQTSFDAFAGTVSATMNITNPAAAPTFELVSTVDPPNFAALTPSQVNGMVIFTSKGKCITCHKGPDFTGAGLNLQFTQTVNQESVIERMFMGDNGIAIYDNGFYNIGVTPAAQDLGVGAHDPFGNPLSFARQLKQMVAGQTVPDPFLVNPCMLEAQSCVPVTSPHQRDAVDGSFKTPTLRNVELTGPYMHDGSMATLEQVVDFYNRGGNHRGSMARNTSGFDHSPAWGNNPSNLDTDIHPLGLTDQEKADLVAFMKGLTDPRVRCEQAPFDHPSLPNFNGHTGADGNGDGKMDDVTKVLPSVGKGGRPAKGLACLQPFTPPVTPPVPVGPTFISTPVTTASELLPYSYQVQATDEDNMAMTYSLTKFPSGMTINASTGLISWTPNSSAAGSPKDVAVRATSQSGLYSHQSFTIIVANNVPPTIISTPPLTAQVGKLYRYQFQATDIHQPITYAKRLVNGVDDNPAGLSVNSSTGEVTWTPTAAQVGSRIVRLQATDATGLVRGHANFSVVVTNPVAPKITTSPVTTAAELVPYSYDVHATDANGDAITYSLTASPASMTINPTTGLISWAPTLSDAGSPKTVGVRATDAGGLYTSQVFTLIVANNVPPTITSTPPLTAKVGVPYVYNFRATDAQQPITYAKRLVNGVEYNPAGLSVDPSTGDVTWTPTAAGNQYIRLQATDATGQVRAHANFTVVVAP
jgi:cytochrome c peroxidase